MKPPRRIEDMRKKKNLFLEQSESKLNKSLYETQAELFRRIAKQIIARMKSVGDKIADTSANYALLASLPKIFKEHEPAAQRTVAGSIFRATSGIVALNNQYFSTVLGEETAKIFAGVKDSVVKIINQRLGIEGGKIISGSFLEVLIKNDSLLLELKQFMANSITAQVPTKQFMAGVSDIVIGAEGKPGGYEGQFKRFAHDIYMQYDRAYSFSLATKLKLKYFIYQGGRIETSRDFCVAHDGKVWSADEAEKFRTWTPADGEYPAGYKVKQKDVNAVPSYLNYEGYNPLIDLGGYNCRHFLSWISDDLAEKLRPELKK